MLKALVGRGHQEFATNRQQDAFEYLLHLYSLVERNSRGQVNPCEALKYEIEDRIECGQSKQVRYTRRSDYVFSLPVAVEAATNKDEVAAYEAKLEELKAEAGDGKPSKPAPRLKVPFTACLEKFAATESVDDFMSPATKTKGIAHRTSRLATFPDYLTIHFRKFTLSDDWIPQKLDVSIDVPDDLDLTAYRGKGLQPGEKELPEGGADAEPEPQINEAIVEQLMSMGFHREGCRKAVYYTKNLGTEAAMNWVLEHMQDPDFSEPLQVGNSQKKQKTEQPISEESLVMIQSMGFTKEQATKALRATDNNVERAVEWIFSHMDELDSDPMDTGEAAASTSQQSTCRDGSGKYKLVAFISHMGTSTSCGHYVCHILKEGRWVIYNDRKVAQSEKPPRDLGYLYFYRRV
ncbi:putative ubiquitin carboxyl-terminal hydrolase 5 [Apostichopus japonicus]|uniref:ubiquitinyl hydrolase 1 n=1 Tax=Stichopus japonicus TaxID=307972 RepID=A0A2G8JS61_STIJA|nr:putative ubiquitin carboxyl-terminal hydrolase 5 [Apostichopus japonicus]